MDPRERFADLQRGLASAWEAGRVGSDAAHTTVALPSFSLEPSLLAHYGTRIPALENRYLHCVLLARRPNARVIFLSSAQVQPDVLAGYLDLVPDPSDVLSRVHFVTVSDPSPGELAAKLLDRPDLLQQVRDRAHAHGPAVLEPWNVTEVERDLALALDIPLFGTAPELRSLATKSNGRRLLRDAGVPVPPGVEDVRTVDEVLAAVRSLEAPHGVVAKLDDSGSGDGNVVLPAGLSNDEIRARLPDWWVEALVAGGIVEHLVSGSEVRSPSCQADITPTGDVLVLSTHEQRLGGPDGQVYQGCSFPADPAYAVDLARHTEAAGRALAAAGALGRFAVDFMAVRSAAGWQLSALEINLRKGGTTHPYGLARLLTGGHYDPDRGELFDPEGRSHCYVSTDNLLDPARLTRTPAEVRRRLIDAGLSYDGDRREGVVPHLLDCMAIDGRMGYTVMGRDAHRVAELEGATLEALRG